MVKRHEQGMKKKLAICFLSIAACLATATIADQAEDNARARVVSGLAGKTIRFDERSVQRLRSPLSDRRNRYVVFFDSDGSGYIWLTGQNILRRIVWEVEVTSFSLQTQNAIEPTHFMHVKMCLKGFPGRSVLCRSREHLENSIQEITNGDPFELRSLSVPCRLCRADSDFATILKITGGN